MIKINNAGNKSIAKKNQIPAYNSFNRNNIKAFYYIDSLSGQLVITNPNVVSQLSSTDKQILECLLMTGDAKIIESIESGGMSE